MANSKSDCVCVHHVIEGSSSIAAGKSSFHFLTEKWGLCRGQGRLDPPLSSPDIQSAGVACWFQSEALGCSLYVSSGVIITLSISCSQVSHNNLLMSLPFSYVHRGLQSIPQRDFCFPVLKHCP